MPGLSFEGEQQFSEDLGLFEAAAHVRPLDIPRPTLATILHAADGSNQDATAELLLEKLNSYRPHQRVHIRVDDANADQLPALVRAQKAIDLIVLPVPFGEDISTLKEQSLGTVVDVVLLESRCPVLCIRQPLDERTVAAALANVVVSIDVAVPALALRAVGWALHLLAPGGTLCVLAVADAESLTEASKLLHHTVDLTTLERTLAQEVASLTAAIQHRSVETRHPVRVESRIGRPVPIVLMEVNRQPALLVTSAERDHTTGSFHRAVDFILGAKGPVLMV